MKFQISLWKYKNSLILRSLPGMHIFTNCYFSSLLLSPIMLSLLGHSFTRDQKAWIHTVKRSRCFYLFCPFLYFFFTYFIHMGSLLPCVCAPCTCFVPRGARKDLLWIGELPCRCWDLNPGPVEELCPSLLSHFSKPHFVPFWWIPLLRIQIYNLGVVHHICKCELLEHSECAS